MAAVEHLGAENEALRRRIAALESSLERVTGELDDLRQAISLMPAIFAVVKGKDHVFTIVNKYWIDWTGRHEVIGGTFHDMMPEQDHRDFIKLLDHILATGETIVGNGMPFNIDPDGSGKLQQRWLTFHDIPLRGTDGEPTGILCYGVDVTTEVLAQRATEALTARLRTFFALAENAPDGIFVMNESKLVYANPAFGRMVGYGEQSVGKLHSELVDEESRSALGESHSSQAQKDGWQGTLTYRRHDGSKFFGQVSTFPILDEKGQRSAEGCIVRDLTQQRRMEEEQRALQEQIIATQERAIRELSTPLIPLARGLVVMPLVGDIDATRAAQIMETLLRGIAAQRARIAILDVTGVKGVDACVAGALLRAAQAANLLGTEVVFTGIRPDIAQLLVEIGADLGSVKTRGTLESAVAYALRAP